MEGWKDRKYQIEKYDISEDDIWKYFNNMFFSKKYKTTSYKFGFLKSVFDNLFRAEERVNVYYLDYDLIFDKFAENYWGLITNYHIHQYYPEKNKPIAGIEKIMNNYLESSSQLGYIEYEKISEKTKKDLVDDIKSSCKRYVIGALNGEFERNFYNFDITKSGFGGIEINACIYVFMMKHRKVLENLNYYAWSQWLEELYEKKYPGEKESLQGIITKLEIATPRRKNLSIFEHILYEEFGQKNCFYCGRKLKKADIDVDHFIPWSFMKNDQLWNLVLSCSHCNRSKNNRIPCEGYLIKIVDRNDVVVSNNDFVVEQYKSYKKEKLKVLWEYSQNFGYGIYENKVKSDSL